MGAGDIVELIAVLVTVAALLVSSILNVILHRSNVYKDTIINYKLNWINEFRKHMIELTAALNADDADTKKLREIQLKTELLLNTDEPRRATVRTLCDSAFAATIRHMTEQTENTRAGKDKHIRELTAAARKCLEFEWLHIRIETSKRADREKNLTSMIRILIFFAKPDQQPGAQSDAKLNLSELPRTSPREKKLLARKYNRYNITF
ncbi:MAG: hypothetical protein LBS99_01040 [Clostridiales bacterium]|jgi:hypothetical protein|nr:hypothetical protein [Clostridiales bacterium]